MLDYELNHTLILCSIDRESDVFKLLDSIVKTEISRKLKIIFVESSENFEYIERVKKYCETEFNLNSHFVFNKAGLPSCRNLGIDIVKKESEKPDLVHFLDDDTTLPPGYFKAIELFFLANPGVSGGGPRIADLYQEYSKNLLLVGLGITPFLNAGKITRSGRNYWIEDNELQKSIPVDWIPGCCMVFRPEIFEQFRFNAKMERGPGQNYALGEDADFTYRVSRKFRLASIPSTKIWHHLAPSKRDNENLMLKASAIWYAYLCRIAKGEVNKNVILFVAAWQYLLSPFLHSLFHLKVKRAIETLKAGTAKFSQFSRLFKGELKNPVIGLPD